jgi:multisubunit Na+/H+ antiporter MnhE subunit
MPGITNLAYVIFGFAVGTFVCGLIAKFHKKESSWIEAKYLFLLSGVTFLLFVYVAWDILKGVFT